MLPAWESLSRDCCGYLYRAAKYHVTMSTSLPHSAHHENTVASSIIPKKVNALQRDVEHTHLTFIAVPGYNFSILLL